MTGEYPRARVLSALALRLPELVPEALAAARDIIDDYRRIHVLAVLAPHIPEGLLPEALAAARDITDDYRRVDALAVLESRLPELLPQALAAARDIAYEYPRNRALAELAAPLADRDRKLSADADKMVDWRETLRVLVASGRLELLTGVTALMPWLDALATLEQLAEIASAIRDVARCWP